MVILLCYDVRNDFSQVGGIAILINVICSLISGIGFSLRAKDIIGRLFVGTVLPVFLFVFNVLVVVVVGCSSMGRIAP